MGRSRSPRRSRSPPRPPPARPAPRIDRHECRRKAIEFLTRWDDSRSHTEGDVEREIAKFLRQRPHGWDSLSYAAEILRGLLGRKRGLVVADRWIMGILAEDVQKTLGPGELSVLRWAAFELLNHPNIPTTVVINEANQVAKLYCPNSAALVHAAVNRMIETHSSIGGELSFSKESGRREEPAFLKKFPPLDPQAQLALLLIEQQRKRDKRARVGKGAQGGGFLGWQEGDWADISSKPSETLKKIEYEAERQLRVRTAPHPLRKEGFTQTFRDPINEPLLPS